MISISEEVKCAVCKNIFCCSDCRKRHELNAHNQNDVWCERNKMNCSLCNGFANMEFRSRNDFALIMHLCQTHLPLHCKKCSTQFNSIGDFSAVNKCAHVNEVCDLESTKANGSQKSFENSISDVSSLRNCSAILYTSNPMNKTPSLTEKVLVRQTSTPMHQLNVNDCCNSCSLLTSGQVSSSSESDTSPSLSTTGQISQQKSYTVTQKKTFKRHRNTQATPLTRQVMTKSIHRAILEFQHCQSASPKSPLDLRVRSALQRDKINETESSMKISFLETVYEQARDDNETNDNDLVNMTSFLSQEETNDIWYTPKQTNLVDCIENFTPKTSKMRSSIFDVDNVNQIDGEPVKSTGLLWSFVSTIFKFASLKTIQQDKIKAPVIIDHNSLNGILCESNENQHDEASQPIKRRKMESSYGQSLNNKKRIQCRPSIHRTN